jgi:hypothetical protein
VIELKTDLYEEGWALSSIAMTMRVVRERKDRFVKN